jgi:hypothetical protein
MRIYPLSEGSFSIDSTKVFIPFEGDIQNRPPGSILVQVQPFVVVTENDIILLDTGLGYFNNQGFMNSHRLQPVVWEIVNRKGFSRNFEIRFVVFNGNRQPIDCIGIASTTPASPPLQRRGISKIDWFFE